ncbi:MAG: pectinesterase family protein [Tepidisphaeraceae bacterium]|jgi:pectinesterase
MIGVRALNWASVIVIGALAGSAAADAAKLLVVAADGTGFSTVQAAIDSIPDGSQQPVTIYIKPGTYTGQIKISANKPPIRMYGDDAQSTILIFNLEAKLPGPDGKPLGTTKTASTYVQANDFEADDLTFSNSTPRDVAQALALAAQGDRQIYRRCRFVGWQDTLYTNGGPPPASAPSTRSGGNPLLWQKPVTPANRLYFEDCHIEGGVDFIFGNSTAVFRNCEILSKRRGYLTAASTPQGVAYGYVFMNCKLTAREGVKDGSVYLGRPWREYANVIYLNCEMGPQINAAGWSEWKSAPERIKTAYNAEYGSTGPGATIEERAPWSHQLTADQAKAITVQSVLGGEDHWDPKPSAQPASRP